MSSSNNNTGIVVLAAGISSRLGSPKQLLTYNGKTLLKHTVDEAADSHADCVVVVVGANAGLFLNEIDTSRAIVVENKEWQEGMASSIRAGLNTLLKQLIPVDGVIFMVCDQPFVSTVVLNDLINTHKETGKPIVACNYGGAFGPPVFFHPTFFTELMQLKGDAGARKIIQQHQDEVATVLFPQGSIDIDKKEDYETLINP